MSEISTLKNLTEKLREKKRREWEEVQEIEQESLTELAASLKISLKNELNSIKKDFEESHERFLNTEKTIQEEILKSSQNLLDYTNATTSDLEKKWEKLNEEKKSYTWLWILLYSAWTITVAYGTIWLKNHKLSEEATQEMVNNYLQKNYLIQSTEDGFILHIREN